MFNMGFAEMLVLGVIALLVIGPKQLPEVARVIGRTLNEFKRATGDLTSTFYSAKREAETYVNKTQNYMHQQKQEFEKSLNLNEDLDHGHHHDDEYLQHGDPEDHHDHSYDHDEGAEHAQQESTEQQPTDDTSKESKS